jgi:hypothetical protein
MSSSYLRRRFILRHCLESSTEILGKRKCAKFVGANDGLRWLREAKFGVAKECT